MRLERLVVASKNPDKVAEVEAVLTHSGLVGHIVRGLTWPDVVENGATLESNALKKARTVATSTGLPAVADDTGLFVRALNDEPGIYAARYAGPEATYAENVKRLLHNLSGHPDRHAEFRTVVALAWPDAHEMLATGALSGKIIERPRGEGGFGYDPVFEVDGRTLAEIPVAEKNRISHRALALDQLAEMLRAEPD